MFFQEPNRRFASARSSAMAAIAAGMLAAVFAPPAVLAQHPALEAPAPAPGSLDQGLAASGTRIRPLTPSQMLKTPAPPQTPGCRHFENGKWVDIPCISDEVLKQLPPPNGVEGIQSTPHGVPGSTGSFTSPLIWGSTTITFLSVGGPQAATETDSHENDFSIQTNTNTFSCTGCSAGQPFQPIENLPNSGSEPGDGGWVQFTFQDFQNRSQALLCIWSVDTTIADHTNNAGIPAGSAAGFATGTAGYHAKCAPSSPQGPSTALPLTGPGAAQGPGEVVGYVTCPSAGSNDGCLLNVVGYLPWSGSNEPYAVTDNDWLGLSGAWTNVSGSILGAGGGAKATFTNTEIGTVLQAYSCYVTSDAEEVTPQACPPPNPPWIEPMLELTAEPQATFATGESNNLLNGPTTLGCQTFNCTLSYDSISPDCVTRSSCGAVSALFTILGCASGSCSLTIAPGETNDGILGQASTTGWPNPEDIGVAISKLPPGVTAEWQQTSKPLMGVPVTGVIDFSAASSAPPSQSAVLISATSGLTTATASLALSVAGVCQPVTACFPGQCGAVPNGCSGTLGCDGCPSGKTCGANNVCISRNTCPPGTHSCGNGVCTKFVCE
jgi:hypothetical protein